MEYQRLQDDLEHGQADPNSPHIMDPSKRPLKVRMRETLEYFGPLGLTAFGGPAAHIAILHSLFVEKLRWLDDRMFSEIFAIGQALPGPTSTQMTFIIAIHRNGLGPAIFAFLLWSLPGLLVMTCLAISTIYTANQMAQWQVSLRNGLAAVAVGLVAASGFKLSSALCKRPIDIVLCLAACCLGIFGLGSPIYPPLIIAMGGLVMFVYDQLLTPTTVRNNAESMQMSSSPTSPTSPQSDATPKSAEILSSLSTAKIALSIFFALLFLSFVLLYTVGTSPLDNALKIISSFYIAGSIIIGGGAVLVPSLQAYVVAPGWMTMSDFLFGISVINVLPGPNFNFSAYCAGVSLYTLLGGGRKDWYAVSITILGSLLGYVGVFFPGLAVKVGILPVWKRMRDSSTMKTILAGVSCTAVGLVYSAVVTLFFDVFIVEHGDEDVGMVGKSRYYLVVAITAFVATSFLKVNPLALVATGGLIGLFIC